MLSQCKLEEIVQSNNSLLDFELLKQISSVVCATTSNGNALGGGSNGDHFYNENQMILNAVNNNHVTSISPNPPVMSSSNGSSSFVKNSAGNNINNQSSTQPNTSVANLSSTTNINNNNNNSSPFSCNHILASLGHNNMILLLANYCISQLYSHHITTTKTMAQVLASSNPSVSNKKFNLNALSAMPLPEHLAHLSIVSDPKYSDSSVAGSSLMSADLLGTSIGYHHNHHQGKIKKAK